MAKFILFGNQKGGVGKTTLTALCANTLSSEPFNFKVCVVDADRQKSFTKAREIDSKIYNSLPYEVKTISAAEIDKHIDELEEYDYVFLDVQGKIDEDLSVKNQENTKLLLLTDFVFIPFVSGSFGTDTSIDFLKFLLELKKIKTDLKIHGLLNMFQPRTKEAKALQEEMKVISRVFGIEFLRSGVGNLSMYRNIDTVTSPYSKENFKVFFDEFFHVIK